MPSLDHMGKGPDVGNPMFGSTKAAPIDTAGERFSFGGVALTMPPDRVKPSQPKLGFDDVCNVRQVSNAPCLHDRVHTERTWNAVIGTVKKLMRCRAVVVSVEALKAEIWNEPERDSVAPGSEEQSAYAEVATATAVRREVQMNFMLMLVGRPAVLR